jgi:hypothetical protein
MIFDMDRMKCGFPVIVAEMRAMNDGGVVNYERSDSWGIWLTGLHYLAAESDPLATGSLDGVESFAQRLSNVDTRRARPFLARQRHDGSWRAMGFVNRDGGYEEVSPHSSDEARESQRDRYDRHHVGLRKTDDPPPANEIHTRTIRVDDNGWAIES